jgi:predicted RecA/RadA family phage recombinase
MKNFVARGDTLEITAGADIASGAGVLVGSLFGVSTGAIANGAQGTINLTGVYDLPKVGSQAWTVGVAVFWDAGNSQCTTTASTHKRIGAAVAAVGSGAGETTGRVRLNGAAVN